jgi:hypothetical protein
MSKTLTFALMDAPFENARSTTALRLIDLAVKRGYNVNVFAYEGAVYLPFAKRLLDLGLSGDRRLRRATKIRTASASSRRPAPSARA